MLQARISDELGCSNRALRKDRRAGITDENFKVYDKKNDYHLVCTWSSAAWNELYEVLWLAD